MDWQSLDSELDRWAIGSRTATFWWRDDDAHRASPALNKLMALAEGHGIVVALAVIPALTEPAAVPSLERAAARIVQHGYAHRKYAGPGGRALECGGRLVEVVAEDLRAGARRLAELFEAKPLRALVPPWNRIDEDVVKILPSLGFRALSTWRARSSRFAAPGVAVVNTHADVMRWKGRTTFAGEAKVLGELVGHLAARRLGKADTDEPTGMLTHHAAHDDGAWDFLARLTRHLGRHPAARWLTPDEALGAGCAS